LKPELKPIFSWDVPNFDLEHWMPPDPDFGVHVMLFIGSQGDDKSDCFDLLLCTPRWFASRLEQTEVESGQYVVFLKQYDYRKFRSYIQSYIDRCDGVSWPEVANKLDHLASWEWKTFDTQVSPRSLMNHLEPNTD